MITVAASDQQDKLCDFSNYGKNSVDIMAPGTAILSTVKALNANVTAHAQTGDVQFNALPMEYAGTTDGVTGIIYSCGLGNPSDFTAAVSGNIALIERGTLTFAVKVSNAAAAGAVAVIIYNDVVDDFDENGGTLGAAGNWLPAVSVTLAEGQQLLSLGQVSVTVFNNYVEGVASYDGTSMATPFVTGLAGLLIAKYPTLGYKDVKNAILSSADQVTGISGVSIAGGRVNAFSALCWFAAPGDSLHDGNVGLDDAILGLQILSGMASPLALCSENFLNKQNLQMADVISILQKVAGLR
jgi:subtilisin family serine protease